MYFLKIVSLTSHPHFDPLAEDLRRDCPAGIVLRENFGGREPVEHRLDRRAGVSEPDLLQPAAVHELYAPAELALLKASGIGGREVFAGCAEGTDAVDAVDRRIKVLRVFKALLPVDAAQIRGQIE